MSLWIAIACGFAVAVCGCARAEPLSVPHEPIATPPPAPPPDEVFSRVERPPPPVEPRVIAARERDHEYASEATVVARRVVYRASLRVPPGLGEAPPTFPAPAAELEIEVGHDRLRARFLGSGWPVAEGSEVRFRRDSRAVYVFDEDGGRPLAPGHLALWFEGAPRLRTPPLVAVRVAPQEADDTPGELICWFIAEWSGLSGETAETIAHRCERGGTPTWFRLGPWRADRMADVPIEIEREALRADAETPPRLPLPPDPRPFVSQRLVARLPSRRGSAAEGFGPLVVRNGGDARLVLTVGGLPVAWVEPSAEVALDGLRPGEHQVGAMRPLGYAIWHARNVVVPGSLEIRY